MAKSAKNESRAKKSKTKARDRRRATPYHRGQTFGLTALRVTVGGFFVGHGAQKLFGVLGGAGPDATGEAFESMGLRPGRQMALAAGASEMTGGGLLALGAATPLASSMLTGVMATAINKVHRPKGPWVSDGGYEYNVVLIAALFALADAGPGKLSIDHLRGRQRRGFGWALFELGLGLAGSAAVQALADRNQPALERGEQHDEDGAGTSSGGSGSSSGSGDPSRLEAAAGGGGQGGDSQDSQDSQDGQGRGPRHAATEGGAAGQEAVSPGSAG